MTIPAMYNQHLQSVVTELLGSQTHWISTITPDEPVVTQLLRVLI
jgi:hypothetical protein